MTFKELEKTVRILIADNRIGESLELLNTFFQDDDTLDQITLNTARYRSILEKETDGTWNHAEVTLALNQFRSDLLKFLRSKEEYYTFKEHTFGGNNIEKHSTNNHIQVFFSVGTPHNQHQQNYIDRLKTYFYKNGIKLQTLSGWEDSDPLDPIITELKDSSGCLVLAMERYYVETGKSKRGSDQESRITNLAFTSPWLHIEAALARAFDLPLMILKDQSLTNEGLIHNDKQEWGIVRINQHNLEEINQYPVKNFILNWINQVKKFSEK